MNFNPKGYLLVVCFICLCCLIRIGKASEQISLNENEINIKSILEDKSRAYTSQEVIKVDEGKLNQRFHDCLIIGDSLVEGLYAYQVLDEDQCVGIRGARTDLMDAAFKQVQDKQPQIIFLNYGMNDLEFVGGDAQKFIQTYKDKIHVLKKLVPQAQLYVNTILPMSEQTRQKNQFIKITNNLMKRFKQCV